MQIIAPDQPNEIPATSKQGEIIVRPSTEADSAAMIAIYTGYVTHGLNKDAPFEPMQSDDIKRRRKNMQKHRLPHLVAELDGVVIGYAYAVPFRKRPAIAIASSIRSMCMKAICAPALAECCFRP